MITCSSPSSSGYISNIFRCVKHKSNNYFSIRTEAVYLLVYMLSSYLEIYQNINYLSCIGQLNKDEYIAQFKCYDSPTPPPPNLCMYLKLISYECLYVDGWHYFKWYLYIMFLSLLSPHLNALVKFSHVYKKQFFKFLIQKKQFSGYSTARWPKKVSLQSSN